MAAGPRNKLVLVMISFIILIGAILRAGGLFTELWFDEICSIDYVQSTHSAWQALWSIHTDNKHHLIWLWIWVIGPHLPDLFYRIPSFIAGVTLLPLLYRVVRIEWNQTAAMIALLLGTFCYPLIFYSSEARGYSLAVLAAMAAYTLAPDRLRKTSLTRALLFSAVLVLGFLSHLTFIYIYAGLIAWALIELIETRRWTALAYHLPAVAALLLIYFFDVRKLQFGGGPATTAIDVIRFTIGMITGCPTDGIWPWIGAVAIILPAGLGLVIFSRKYRAGRSAFFVTALIVAPAALTAARKNPYLATRYYLVLFPFLLLLISIGLSSILRTLPGKIISRVLLAAFILNAALSTRSLQIIGRGHARDCLMRMSADNHSTSITYSTERMGMDRFCIDYYAKALNHAPQFLPATDQASDWWILDLDSPGEIGPATIHRRNAVYKLDSIYPANNISGLTWDLYHRAQ